MGEESNSAMKRDVERADEVGERTAERSEGRGRGSRIEAPRSEAATGCAYFMAATYHKSLSLMGESRSDDFKEITCRTRPTYTQPC